MKRISMGIAAATAMFIIAGHPAAQANDWPTKPVRIIAPFAAGGSADTLGRIIAEQLSETFKQQFFVENKPGAGGVVGSAQAAKAEPDGYTFVISGIASHVLAPLTNPNTGYDPIKNFTHVAYIGGPPIGVVSGPKLGVKSLKEMVDYGQRTKERLTYASPGTGTAGHVVAEYFARKAGFAVEHVPYRGAAPGIADVVGGHLQFGSMTFTTASSHVRAKTVQLLAVSSDARLAEFPDVPTLKELGYPDLVCTTWFALSAPAGVPADIVEKVNREAVKALARPDVRKRLELEAMITVPMTSAEFTKFVAAEVTRWKPILETGGFKTQ